MPLTGDSKKQYQREYMRRRRNSGQVSAKRRDLGIQEADNMTATYTYYIEDMDSKAFKVGLSSNPKGRLKELQVGNPHKLVLTKVSKGTLKDERALHAKYASSRLQGEWFQSYDVGDELLVQGKAGNVACLVLDIDSEGNTIWNKKFNIKLEETDRCIVEFNVYGDPVLQYLSWTS